MLVDFLTHLLAVLLVIRAGLPRASWRAWICVLGAGLAAELDSASAWFGPRKYLAWHGGGLHSLLAALCFGALAAAVYRLVAPQAARAHCSLRRVFMVALGAALLHLAIDTAQSAGAALLWPFRDSRYRLDWIHSGDVWPLIVFVFALLFPELFEMVRTEIGIIQKAARGQASAMAALAVFGAYLGVRGVLHTKALAMAGTRDYGEEGALRDAAFPANLSPFSWRVLVETSSAIRIVPVSSGSSANFDPDAALTFPKPEASPVLDAVAHAPAVELFLRYARFPKAEVEQTPAGWRVSLRDLSHVALRGNAREVIAEVELDSSRNVTADRLEWLAGR